MVGREREREIVSEALLLKEIEINNRDGGQGDGRFIKLETIDAAYCWAQKGGNVFSQFSC